MTIDIKNGHTCSRLELSQIYLFVRSGAQNDRFNAVEINIIDAAHVSWKFIQNLASCCIPNIYIPNGRD